MTLSSVITYYLCNRWDLDQSIIGRRSVRSIISFNIKWLSSIISWEWPVTSISDCRLTLPFRFCCVTMRIIVMCYVSSNRWLPLLPILIWDHIQGWIKKKCVVVWHLIRRHFYPASHDFYICIYPYLDFRFLSLDGVASLFVSLSLFLNSCLTLLRTFR